MAWGRAIHGSGSGSRAAETGDDDLNSIDPLRGRVFPTKRRRHSGTKAGGALVGRVTSGSFSASGWVHSKGSSTPAVVTMAWSGRSSRERHSTSRKTHITGAVPVCWQLMQPGPLCGPPLHRIFRARHRPHCVTSVKRPLKVGKLPILIANYKKNLG